MSIQITTRQRNALNAAFVLVLLSCVLLVVSFSYPHETLDEQTSEALLWLALTCFVAAGVVMAVAGVLDEVMRRVFKPFTARGLWIGLVAAGLVIGLHEASKLL